MTTPDRFARGAIDLSAVNTQAQTPQQETAGSVAPVVMVDHTNIEQAVVQRSAQVPVVVHIGTERSPDSQSLHSNFTELAQAQSPIRWIYAYVDADTQPQLAQMLGVQGLPTVLVLAGGQPITSFQGGQPAEALSGWIDAILQAVDGKLSGLPAADEPSAQPPVDPRIAAIEAQRDAGEFTEALAAIDALQASEPAHKELERLRADVRFAQRLAAAAPAEDELDEQMLQADTLIAGGDPAAGFDHLLNLLATRHGEEKQRVRTRLVEILALFEPTQALVIDVRRRMASALF
ncbi:tetratricopeptide repeat protein [Corynebacterium choanae]|uniref:Thioredoxin C-1 n=1 Tax=Corynebacterium choanae TaxID=1862358 RepID=A0A3G6J8X4_9CORY|nr:tetratricopeptide repeat protein [Corynebacterium choanae]AZA13338.1 Thioredoxin C-1 [Corynebacterium choanae]